MSGDQLDLDEIEARALTAPSGSRCVCSWQMAQARYIAHAREDVPALVAEVRRLREECADAWDGGHKTRWRLGPDNCQCSAWSSGECACGEYGTGELLSLAQNPYR